MPFNSESKTTDPNNGDSTGEPHCKPTCKPIGKPKATSPNTTVNQTEKLAELARQEKAKLALEREAVKVAAARVDHLNKMQRCNSFEVLRKNNEKMMPVIDKVVDFFLYLSEVPEKVAEFDDIY